VQILSAVLSNGTVFNSIVEKLIEDTDKLASNIRLLKFHPDKGGNYEDWHKLQCCLAVIKVSFTRAVTRGGGVPGVRNPKCQPKTAKGRLSAPFFTKTP